MTPFVVRFSTNGVSSLAFTPSNLDSSSIVCGFVLHANLMKL